MSIIASREEVREIKVTICEIADLEATEIVIKCDKISAEIERLAALFRGAEEKITGMRNAKTYILEPAKILYFDTVDSRTFIYTTENIFETSKRLYEIEERLAGEDFFRSSKAAIINIQHIVSLCPEFGGRLECTMTNGERLVVSRSYASKLKSKLGLR